MATTLLEREIEKLTSERADAQPKATEKSREQILHDKRIHENYENLLSATKTAPAPIAAPAQVEPSYEEPFTATYASPAAAETNTARRIADYTAVSAPKGGLFEGVTFRNGTLIDTNVKAAPAPARTVSAVTSADADDEDALPTQRTLDTLRRTSLAETAAVMATSEENKVSFSLSAKAKTILAVIIVAVIAAIAIICVNTSILNALGVEVSDLAETADRLGAQAQQIAQDIVDVTSEDNIIEWAISQGMIRQP